MAEVDKKSASSTTPQEVYEKGNGHVVGSSTPEFYDPSKESIWTRLGLTAESFKRAPGTTGYVHTYLHKIYASLRLSGRLSPFDEDFAVVRLSRAGTRPRRTR